MKKFLALGLAMMMAMSALVGCGSKEAATAKVIEIELTSEDEQVVLPDFLTVLRDVSAEGALKNRALALRVPLEEEIRFHAVK